MLNAIKSSFLWQFAAGFALGAVGLAAVHATEARAEPAPTHLAR